MYLYIVWILLEENVHNLLVGARITQHNAFIIEKITFVQRNDFVFSIYSFIVATDPDWKATQ